MAATEEGKKLKIAEELLKLPTVRLGDIRELQGNLKDLSKDNYDKLLKRLQSKGFLYPLYLWFDQDGIPYTLDGKQRHRVIENEYGPDTRLPYIEVKAKDRKAAKLEILAISSDYGTVTKKGFNEFAEDFGTQEFDEINNETTFNDWGSKSGYFQKQFDTGDEFDEVAPYPITVVINEHDYKIWENIKKELNETSDFKVFMKIYKEYNKKLGNS